MLANFIKQNDSIWYLTSISNFGVMVDNIVTRSKLIVAVKSHLISNFPSVDIWNRWTPSEGTLEFTFYDLADEASFMMSSADGLEIN
jgi:hypothetical protein